MTADLSGIAQLTTSAATLLGVIYGIFVSLRNGKQGIKNHLATTEVKAEVSQLKENVDGKMEKLLTVTAEASEAKGVLGERQAHESQSAAEKKGADIERARHKEPTK